MAIRLSTGNGFVAALSVLGLLSFTYAGAFSQDWNTGVDAALDTTSAGKIYFFKGHEYSRLTDTKVDPSYPLPMPGGWRGLPASWHSGIDAAVSYAPTEKIYLFKGRQYESPADWHASGPRLSAAIARWVARATELLALGH